MTILKGQCLCGAIQYEIKAEPQLSFLCQCRQCQRITGSGHSAEFVVSDKDVSMSGEVQSYELKSDKGNVIGSQFCPTCGNPVFKKSSGYPGLLFFHAATLDNPEIFKPQMVFWASSCQPWDSVSSHLEIKQKV